MPSVEALLLPEHIRSHGRARTLRAARTVLSEARASTPIPDRPSIEAAVARRLALGTRAVINATGVLLHTNLGRAPWAPQAIDAAIQATGYCNVELDLHTGRRGGRGAGVADRLAALTGAEAALVVNNNAAAVLLMLSALAKGREVIVSRGELVEIGGGFRVPDVLRASGAELVEVGTTNRTHLRDYQAVIGERTAAVLSVHPSNFRQVGFVATPGYAELARLGPPLLVDLGSGALDEDGDEPTVAQALDAGAQVVCVSGDKLLGGPQAGIALGSAALIGEMSRHPLMRAMRAGKVTLAALEGTLDAWLTGGALPIRAMREASLDLLHAEVEGWLSLLGDTVEGSAVQVEGAVGGGTTPGRTWPSVALAITRPGPEALRAALLQGSTPVVGRIREGALLLDARTVAPLGQGPALITALQAALAQLR